MEGDLLEFRAELLRGGLIHTAQSHVHDLQGIPGLLGRLLDDEDTEHLRQNDSEKNAERRLVVAHVLRIALDRVPESPGLQVHLHDERPLDVVRGGECWEHGARAWHEWCALLGSRLVGDNLPLPPYMTTLAAMLPWWSRRAARHTLPLLRGAADAAAAAAASWSGCSPLSDMIADIAKRGSDITC